MHIFYTCIPAFIFIQTQALNNMTYGSNFFLSQTTSRLVGFSLCLITVEQIMKLKYNERTLF